MKLPKPTVLSARDRRIAISDLLYYLQTTTWGRGIYTQHRAVPGARPGQLRAGARKLFERLRRDDRIFAAEKAGEQ
jgi:hypothetical protein